MATNAVIPAGTSGSIDIWASNSTDLLVDITGFFIETTGLSYYPITPCRIVETRPDYAPPDIGQLFGPPALVAGVTRSFPFPQGRCNIPVTAQAYHVNITVVPSGALVYLVAYPTGSSLPNTSTLNSWDGRILANGAIVPAGIGSGVNVYSTNPTHLIVDVAGYFAPSNGSGLMFNTIVPCRTANISVQPTTDAFVPMAGTCWISGTAAAYAANVTAAVSEPLAYISAWPSGAAWPGVSLLNAFDAIPGTKVGNAALLSAGSGGQIALRSTAPATVTVDVNGFFTPEGTGGGGGGGTSCNKLLCP